MSESCKKPSLLLILKSRDIKLVVIVVGRISICLSRSRAYSPLDACAQDGAERRALIARPPFCII